jgi:hypothetical protein
MKTLARFEVVFEEMGATDRLSGRSTRTPFLSRPS